jgi:hypothetical protein
MVEDIKWIDINGAQVVDVTPDHHRELALVDLEVLNKLTELLPIGDLYEIKKGLKEKIVSARSIEAIVKVCDDFAAFHRTVNLIQKVNVHLHTPAGEEEVNLAEEAQTPLAC